MENMKTLEEVRKIFEGDRFATENGAVIEKIGTCKSYGIRKWKFSDGNFWI